MTRDNKISWTIDAPTYRKWKRAFSEMAGKSKVPAEDAGSGAEWLDFLLKQRVAPYYYRACRDSGSMDGGFLEESLKRYLLHFTAANEIYKKEALEVIAKLNSEGIIPLLVKGIQLQNDVYPSPALRPTSDLDIVIRNEEEHSKALQLLSGLGYTRYVYRRESYARKVLKEIVVLPPPGRKVMVELHHSLRFGLWDKRRKEDVPFLEEANLNLHEIDGVKYYGLSSAANYLFLCYHTFQSHVNIKSLMWINDLNLLKDSLLATGGDVCSLAERTGTLHHAAFCDLLLEGLRGGSEELPSFVDDGFSVAEAAGSKMVIEFRNIDGIGRKLAWIAWMAFPSRQYVERKYGPAGGSLSAYFKHFAGIVRGLGRIGRIYG